MAWRLSMGALFGIIAALISAVLAYYALQHREKRMALQFALLKVTLAVWSLAYAVQLGYATLGGQLFWQRITLGVAGFIPTVFLLFIFAYTSKETWLSRTRVALLSTEPIVWFLLCITNPMHGLIWTDAGLTSTVLAPVTALEFGIGYVVHIAYGYAIVALGLALLVLHATKVAPAYQKQVGLILLGVIPPFLCHILFTLGVSPVPALDLTPFAFSFTGIVFGFALFKFDLLQLAPIAREQAFHEAGDGLLIVNPDGEIVDVLGVARDVLSPRPRIGVALTDIFPDTSLDDLDDTNITAVHSGEQRVYNLQVSSIAAHHDQQVGTILILRDITNLHETRQRLSVSNRILRHNLRNDMNVVLGYANELESKLDGQEGRQAEILRKKVEHFLGLASKAEQVANIHSETGDEDETETTDLVARLQEVVSDQRDVYPEVAVSLDVPAATTVDGVDPETFKLAVRNLIDNAVEHNDSETPRVTVAVEEDAGETRVEIADNGPGIPETEREAVGADVETQLGHSQGLGLWLTYWCTNQWGGELRLDTDQNGTVATLVIPKQESATDAEPSRTATSFW